LSPSAGGFFVSATLKMMHYLRMAVPVRHPPTSIQERPWRDRCTNP
jgi:hypothetical protein